MILRDPEAKYSRKDLPLISKFSCVCFGTDQILVRQWYGSKLRESSLENYTGNGEAPLWKFIVLISKFSFIVILGDQLLTLVTFVVQYK